MELSGIELNGLDWNGMEEMGLKKISEMDRVEKIKKIRMMLANKYSRKDVANIFVLPEKTLKQMTDQPYCFMLSDQLARQTIFPVGWKPQKTEHPTECITRYLSKQQETSRNSLTRGFLLAANYLSLRYLLTYEMTPNTLLISTKPSNQVV
jgi:hypothetical protein